MARTASHLASQEFSLNSNITEMHRATICFGKTCFVNGEDEKQSTYMRQIRENQLVHHEEIHLRCEECQRPLWKAGEVVSAGTYVRVDDQSYRAVLLEQEGPCKAQAGC